MIKQLMKDNVKFSEECLLAHRLSELYDNDSTKNS